MAGGKDRIVWAVVLAEREGLSLLFIQKPDEKQAHQIVIASENVRERVFESVNATSFHFEHDDLAGIGIKLQALGESLCDNDFRRYFNLE